MALGLMILPPITARFWSERLETMFALSVLFAALASLIGLLVSYYVNVPSGPAIILVAGAWYGVSLVAGPFGGIIFRYLPRKHWNPTELS
jgi:zinc/manganese transport system permease protein